MSRAVSLGGQRAFGHSRWVPIHEEGLGITLPRGCWSSLFTRYGWAELEVLGGQKRHCVTLRGHPPDILGSVEEPRLTARELRSWDSHVCSWLHPSSSLPASAGLSSVGDALLKPSRNPKFWAWKSREAWAPLGVGAPGRQM